uniref:Uncharacterized protein n=1 Tax=Geospiza parvula TaxID=87175 RepID=A0A8U8BLU6_GEOPR
MFGGALPAAHRFVLRHVGELGAQLERLPLPRLLSYLRDDGLCIPKEEAAFQLALRWVRADPATRAPLLPQLLAHVRLPFVRRFYLLAHVESEPLVARCPPCLRLLREARDFQAARLDRHDRGPCARMRPRPSTGLLAGMKLPPRNSSQIPPAPLLDQANAPWSQCVFIVTLQVHVGGSVAVLGGKLYVSGGYDNTFELSDVLEAYDPETRTWTDPGESARGEPRHSTAAYRHLSLGAPSPCNASFATKLLPSFLSWEGSVW